MLSVLVGVAVAVGGHLLWLQAPRNAPATAMPGPDSQYNSSLQRAEPGSATPSTDTTESSTTTEEPEPTTEEKPPETSERETSSASEEQPPASSSPESPDTSSTTPSEPTSPPKSSSGDGSLTTQVANLVNDERATAGCGAVSIDSRLTGAAQKHSDDMARRGYLDHTTPEGVSFDQRIERAGYPSPAAENIAMGLSSADAVMHAWMSSDGHRQNILNCDIKTIGVGVNSQGWYWTQNFGY
ncbi:Uncharacterized conserved protein YkwD, contains CAP (CSP/antigen 5/PR1) domain [Prauserella marina]|uniref:Uncharacterized conserved protein YkwD, contains CAP (CSP/antigen 5/PR1) domain n=1 Tax=Prauserella marina TaxID=530584 RepID=A0A1G6SLZ5_9PSEU|nr:CAP domain-containing protein [Prauserella marina]PWV82032.1 uncharacterized protein YkwD [Prauserella marina]SDD17879.1 Uncharacterized conserved protein YkwD, contains CAP (CSP/antigen 5/PR1) domain [Prauserella marina]